MHDAIKVSMPTVDRLLKQLISEDSIFIYVKDEFSVHFYNLIITCIY